MNKLTNKVFFGEHGLTSTAANHLAELAQEIVTSNKSKLEQTSFVNAFVDIVGSNSAAKQVQVGYSQEKLDEIQSVVEQIAEMNSFCAWMREAVKAKEAMDEKVAEMQLWQWCQDNGIEQECLPMSPDPVKMEEIVDELNVKERCEYFALEAKAATIGQYIHPEEPFSEARKRLHDILANPVSTAGEGASLLIYNYEPSVSEAKVEELYLALQKEHRQNEQKLNQIKASLKLRLTAKSIEQQKEFAEKTNESNAKIARQQSDFESWRVKERERISKLKIVVPQDLQKTYDYLSALDK